LAMSIHDNLNPWWVAGTAVILAGALLAFGRGRPAATAESMSISITVIPPDAVNLDCSSGVRFGDTQCAFDAAGKPQQVAKPLRPYVTTSRELLLLSGVFEEPNVSTWLQRARQTRSDARVTLNCDVTTLGRLRTVVVRWQTGAAWGQEKDVPVAKVKKCQVVP